MPTEHHRDDEPVPYQHRRAGDNRINWSTVGIFGALTIQLLGWVWVASARNSDIIMLQASIAKLDASVNTLQNTTNNNTIRLGVVESKVDDLRDSQRTIIK